MSQNPPDSNYTELVTINEQIHAMNRKLVARAVDAEAALSAAQDEIERLLADKESVRARIDRIKTKDDCPVGTVATIGHPANRVLMVKGTPTWRYVTTGESVDYDSLYKCQWDVYALPIGGAS